MKKIILIVGLFFIVLYVKSQSESYTNAEQKTFASINNWFNEKNVNWENLQHYFENYFQTGGITNKNKPIEQQYYDILSFFEAPSKRFPIFKDKKKIVEIMGKLGFSKGDIRLKKHLSRFNKSYSIHKNLNDTTSTYYIFGSTVETILQIPNISPGVVAGTIRKFAKKKDLKKKFYQRATVLLFAFDMTLFLND